MHSAEAAAATASPSAGVLLHWLHQRRRRSFADDQPRGQTPCTRPRAITLRDRIARASARDRAAIFADRARFFEKAEDRLRRWELPRLTNLHVLGPGEGAVPSVAGYVSWRSGPAGELEVLQLAVHEDFRRRGLGRRLLEFVLRRAGARGVRLHVRADNAAAQRLYSSCGFCAERLDPAYYLGEPGILMRYDRPEASRRPAPRSMQTSGRGRSRSPSQRGHARRSLGAARAKTFKTR